MNGGWSSSPGPRRPVSPSGRVRALLVQKEHELNKATDEVNRIRAEHRMLHLKDNERAKVQKEVNALKQTLELLGE